MTLAIVPDAASRPRVPNRPIPLVSASPDRRGVTEAECLMPGVRAFNLRMADGGFLGHLLVPDSIVDEWFIGWLWEMLDKHDPVTVRLI